MTRRILIADDHVPTRRDLQVFLQTQGYEVVAVGNGDLAARRAKETYPELIVLDFLMPGQTGYEACKYIRHTLQYNAPILIIYNDFEPFSRDEAIQAGADEVMAKPLDPFALLDTFTRLWRQYGRSGPDTGSFSLGDDGDDAFEPDIPVSDNVELPPPMNSMEMEVPAELRGAVSPEPQVESEDSSMVPDYEKSLPPEYRFVQSAGPPTAEFEKELTDTLDDILGNLDELGPIVEAEAEENVPQPTTNDWFSTPPANEWRATPTGELAQDVTVPPPHYVDEVPPPAAEEIPEPVRVRSEMDFSDVAAEVAAEEAAREVIQPVPARAEHDFSDVAEEVAAAPATAPVENDLVPEVPPDPRPSRDSLADPYSVVASGFYAAYFEDENKENRETRPFSDPYPSRNMFAPLPSQVVGEMNFVVPERITGELPAPDLSEGVSIHFDTMNASVQIEGLYEVDEVELPESVTQDLSTVTILPPADQTEMYDEADVAGDHPTGELPAIESVTEEPVKTLTERLTENAPPEEPPVPATRPLVSNTTPLSGSFLAPDFGEPVGSTTSAFCPNCFGAINREDVICPHCGQAV